MLRYTWKDFASKSEVKTVDTDTSSKKKINLRSAPKASAYSWKTQSKSGAIRLR